MNANFRTKKKQCKPISGLITNTFNLFQDDTGGYNSSLVKFVENLGSNVYSSMSNVFL